MNDELIFALFYGISIASMLFLIVAIVYAHYRAGKK